jgi:predicted dehydrogenase
VAIFTPHRAHYQPALDALQSGCHVFVEKPLSTNPQEAMDLVRLGRGRDLLVGVGHQYRLRPSLIAARNRLASGEIGRVRLVSAIMAGPWLEAHGGPDNSWRFDPKVSGGGIIADAGDHLLDTLLWMVGQPVSEVAAFQDRVEPGLDVVNAVALRLGDSTLATIGLAGTAATPDFELVFHGDRGVLRATESAVRLIAPGVDHTEDFPGPAESIDANFVAAVRGLGSLCCPAEEALESVRLQDAIGRAAATGQVVRLG